VKRLLAALFLAASLSLVASAASASTPRLHLARPATAKAGTNYCIGEKSKCIAFFPAPDDFGAVGLEVGAVVQNAPCPNPGVCAQPAGDQLDWVGIVIQAGSSGMPDPASEMSNFSLILSNGSQGRIDSVTCDESVEYGLCGLGPEAPEAVFGATMYFDVPEGTSYSQVNFLYSSGGTQLVYSFSKAATIPAKPTKVEIRNVAGKGGKVKWMIWVSKATWCVWSSSPIVPKFNGSVRCSSGKVERTVRFKPNTTPQAKTYILKVRVIGESGETYYLKVVEASAIFTSTVKVESYPAGVAVDSKTSTVYVANSGADTV
jgi:hypothetical protein